MARPVTWPKDEFEAWVRGALPETWAAAVTQVQAARNELADHTYSDEPPVESSIVELHQLMVLARVVAETIAAAVAQARDLDVAWSAIADALGYSSAASARAAFSAVVAEPDPGRPPALSSFGGGFSPRRPRPTKRR